MIFINLDAELKNARRIGIMGGTFDPVHYGHLTAAECARCEMNLDFVLFIPAGQPPLKGAVLFNELRYLTALLATNDNPYFRITRMELNRHGVSYTVDTLRMLREKTEAKLFFIIGADEKLQLNKWKEYEQLPSLCDWITVTRPGYELENNTEGVLNIPGIDISGTELRKRIKNGLPLKYLMPPAVERFINEAEIYDTDYESIHSKVAARLSEKRYRHTLGVLQTALLLAARFNINMKKTYLAALLHDYAKEIPDDEKRGLCKKYNIPLDEIQEQRITLIHGALSAELAKREFNITDEDVLNAIKYHTTGRSGMGALECIIKIADNTEPNRKDYHGLDNIKRLSCVDLTKAAILSIRRDIEYTKNKNIEVHPLGNEALRYLKSKLSEEAVN